MNTRCEQIDDNKQLPKPLCERLCPDTERAQVASSQFLAIENEGPRHDRKNENDEDIR
jgi:hypothetical protein